MIGQLRRLATTMMGGIVLIGVAMYLVLGTKDDGFSLPPTWALVVVIGEAVAVAALIQVVGYRATAVPPGGPREGHVAAFQSGMILRLSLAESTAIIGLALAFILPEGGMTLLLIAMTISLALMALHGYPWERPIERFREQLERDGGTSYLREDLGL